MPKAKRVNATKPGRFEVEVLPVLQRSRGAKWLAGAQETARKHCVKHGTATVDDIWDANPPPKNIERRTMGAVFPRSEFECVGYKRSKRAICHHRPIGIFRLRSARNRSRTRVGKGTLKRFR